MKNIYNDFLDTLSILWHKKIITLGILVFDFLFFLSLIIVHMQTFIPAANDLNEINSIYQEKSRNFPDDPLKINAELIKDPRFTPLYHNFLKELLIFVISSFIIFFLFQGMAWLISHLAFGKINILPFVGKFFISTIITFILFFISSQIFIKSQLIGIVILIIGFYFISVFNSLISQKHSFKKTIEFFKEEKLITAFLTGFFLIIVTSFDLFWLLNYNFNIGIASSLLFLLALSFARIHLLKNINNLIKKHT